MRKGGGRGDGRDSVLPMLRPQDFRPRTQTAHLPSRTVSSHEAHSRGLGHTLTNCLLQLGAVKEVTPSPFTLSFPLTADKLADLLSLILFILKTKGGHLRSSS